MKPASFVWVRATPGRKVPVEGQRRAVFSAETARRVEITPYLRRRLADGDLVVAPGPDAPPAPPAARRGTRSATAEDQP